MMTVPPRTGSDTHAASLTGSLGPAGQRLCRHLWAENTVILKRPNRNAIKCQYLHVLTKRFIPEEIDSIVHSVNNETSETSNDDGSVL